MSQVIGKIKQFAGRYIVHQPGESISNKAQSWTIRDSSPSRGSMTNKLLVLSLGSCLGLVAGATGLFIGADTYATDSTLSLSIDNPNIEMNVSPTLTGSFAKSNPSTITASTNNATGYTLTIAAGDSTDTYNKLINRSNSNSSNGSNNSSNGTNNTNYLASITNAITESQFKALDGTSYNNMWGYLPSKYNSHANTDFLPSPGKGTKQNPADTINQTHCANGTTGGDGVECLNTTDTYTLTLGARVDTTTKIGAYSNTYIVALVGNAIPYSITYIDNTITNMPVDVSGTSDTTTITISDNTPQRNGYTFIGWCNGAVVNNANGTDTCNGTTVNPGGTVTIDQTSTTNNISLYAMWGGNYTIQALVASGATLQDLGNMSSEQKGKILSSMVTDTNYRLKDSRNNANAWYNISKLKDGSVWMTTNLNLAGGTTISAADSDVPVGYTLPTANGFQSDNRLPASSTTGFSDDTMAYVYNSGNMASSGCGVSGDDRPCYAYYSYIAATAGSGLNVTSNGEDAPYSICPKGWRLPTSGDHTITDASNPASYKRGDFYKLATAYGVDLENAYNSNTPIFYNNLGPGTNANFLLSGNYYGSTFSNGGAYGLYWSATGGWSTSHARNLDFGTSYISSANGRSHRNGYSVRCILR